MSTALIRQLALAVYRSKPVRTFAQTLGALLTVAVAGGLGVHQIDWRTILSASALAGIYAFVQATADGSSLSTHKAPRSDPDYVPRHAVEDGEGTTPALGDDDPQDA